MGKHILMGLLIGAALNVMAQPYTPNTVEKLDDLEQSRILLSKELEVVKLQGELQKANSAVGVTAAGASTGGAPLHLIKINGLANNPEAVFLYGGYRVVARKGGMVIPNLQITGVSQSYVVLKDITTGKENVLWLSSQETLDRADSSPSS